MKETLTFIYGLILIGLAIGVCMNKELVSFWDYCTYLLGLLIGIHGFKKLDKSTL